MQINQTFSWPTTNWPDPATPASQYTFLQVYPTGPTPLQNVTSTQATVTLDDSQALAYQVRPSSGPLNNLVYGPELTVFVVNYVPCRAWLRQQIRQSLADRADASTATINWPDDELNTYITHAIIELNLLFPIETQGTINFVPPAIDSHGNQAGVRDYTLPADFYLMRSVEYITPDGKLHLWLKEKPFRGGESTATSYMGYPKLGIMLSPLAGRFYPGHYDIFNGQIHVDWDPVGNGDYINFRYMGKRLPPVNDADIMNILPEDMELLSLYVQVRCALRIELQDTRLSRWREPGKRDDMPTVKHSVLIKQLYDQRVNDRRELRPKTRRLVRR